MAKYILKRVLRAFITLFFIITILFILLQHMPIEGYFENFDKVSPAEIQVKLTSLGLTDPLPKQLARFYKDLFHGDLGTSNIYRMGVDNLTIIAEKVPVSMRIGLISLALSLLMGFALGIWMAYSTRTTFKIGERLGTLLIVIVQAVPSAVYYILIQFMGSQYLKMPMLFKEDNPISYILPIFSLSIGSAAYYAMWLRRYMVDEANKDYVLLARAKGVPSGTISRRHIFRNAMVPLVQYIPGSILTTLMGSLYVESLYSIPGMGGLLVTAIKRQDNTLVQALVLIYAVVSILGLLFGDIMMAIVDPRISLSKKEGSR